MTKAEEYAETREALLKFLKPGATVYTTLLHVSRSGMQREIGLWTIVVPTDGREPYNQYLSGYAAKLLGHRRGKRDGVVVNGCGMDMGFAVVYELSRALWPNGHGCIGEGCPSNDHSNGDRDYTPHNADEVSALTPGYVAHWHNDGGYALKQRWL